MKKHLFLLFTLLLSVTMFAQQTRTNPEGFLSSEVQKTTYAISYQNVDESFTKNSRNVAFSENFNSITNGSGVLPAGWTQDAATTLTWLTDMPTNPGGALLFGRNGTVGMGMAWNSSIPKDAWTFTPGITLTGGTTYQVSFWTKMGWEPGDGDGLSVRIGQTPTRAAMATAHQIYHVSNHYIADWVLISGDFTPATSGTYYLGFYGFSSPGYGNWIHIDDIEVKVPLDNDLAISASYPYTQVPTFLPLQNLSVKVDNVGTNPQTNVAVTAQLNGTTVGTTSVGTVAAGASANVTVVNTGLPTIATGNNTLAYNVTQTEIDEDPSNNTATSTFTGSANIYAVDSGSDLTDGVGSNSGAITLGNIFEITTPCYLKGAEIGFYATLAAKTYTVSLYAMTGDMTTATTAIYTTPTASTVVGYQTINFPYNQLEPGRYFLCINQLTANNVAVLFDADPSKLLYSRNATTGAISSQGGFGATNIRMNLLETVTLVNVTTNVSPEGAGTVTGGGVYAENDQVTLTATPIFGFDFVKWSNGQTANPYTFTATEDVTLTAIFAEQLGGCDEIQIGAGTLGSYTFPINTYWNYSYCQLLYDADEIGEGTRITSISLEYISPTPQPKNLAIYLGNTGKTAFASTADWVPVNQLELVYTGVVNFTNGWVTITFDTPFAYSGCGLVVGILNNHGSYTGGTTNTFNNHATTVNKMISFHRDIPGPIDPAAPAGTTSFLLQRANTKFELCSTLSCGGVEITTGTVANNYTLPMNNWYNRSYTQQIYDAAEIGLPAGTAISSVQFLPFNTTTVSYTRQNQAIYLANTTKSTLAGVVDWIPATDLQLVYSGPISFTHNATPVWQGVEFETPFTYTGGNIALVVVNNAGSYPGTSTSHFFRTGAIASKAMHHFADATTVLTVTTPPTSATVLAYRNHVKFVSCAFGMNPIAVDLQAASISGSDLVPALEQVNYTVTVQNNGTNPMSNYMVKILTAANVEIGSVTVAATLIPGATTGVTVPTIFQPTMVGAVSIKGRVEAFCDAVPANNETPLFAVNILDQCAAPNSITIGTGTLTTTSIPFNFNWGNSIAQTIYLANEIGLEPGMTINQITYTYPSISTAVTPKAIKVYMANTTASNFASSSAWIPLSGLVEVYSGDVALPTGPYQLTIILDEPFVYEGGNLCIATLKEMNSSNWTAPAAQYTTLTPSNRSLYTQSDGVTLGFATPPAGTLSSMVPNIKMLSVVNKVFTLNPNNTTQQGVVIRLVPEEGIECRESGMVYFDLPDGCTQITNVKIGGQSMGPITSYSFPNQDVALPVIEVEAVRIQYTLTPSVDPTTPYGTIDPATTLTNVCGEKITFIITPNFGYTVDAIIFNGVVQNVSSATRKWTTPTIYENSTVVVRFKEAPWKIYITHAGAGEGIIELVENVGTANEMRTEMPNEDPYYVLPVDEIQYHFVFTPAFGSNVEGVYVDGVFNAPATAMESYLFPIITSDRELKVEFGLNNMYILATAGPNGAISPAGNVPVPYGTTKRFHFIPSTGYVVDQVLVNNEPVDFGGNNYYDYPDVTENGTIHVTFTKQTFIIYTPGCQTMIGGSMYPCAPVGIDVVYNGEQRFEFVPDFGYKISKVWVDDELYLPAVQTGSYTFYYVTKSHSIRVEFEPFTYPITASINGNGMISDAGTTYVEHGTNKSYQFRANIGYEVTNLFIDGKNTEFTINANGIGIYTFVNVTAPHTISIITALQKFTINASALGTGGIITPAGNITVNYGDNQAFTFIPAPGHEIEEVKVDGLVNAEAALNGAHTFTNITKNHSIEVSFKTLTFKIASIAGANGAIYPEGIIDVNYGEEVTYEFYPEEGYEILDVLVNNVSVGAVDTYTFTEVDANGTIEVSFIEKTPPVVIDNPTNGISIHSQQNTVYITNLNALPIQDVSIMDMYGRVVWKGIAPDMHNKITLDVANGVYAVRVTANDQFTTTKVFIQR